ncbi:hypothetical protein [Halonotius terrestris]|uniref:hypothetical protein n=1 Tax=Halonotius terrestris TaxID=2487750 RepID=UPI002AA29D42|nr:hypothetical protein [Halonotius terrestris]
MSPERTGEESSADDGSSGDDRSADATAADEGDRVEPRGAADIGELEDQLAELRSEFDEFEADIEDRTVDKPSVEADLKRYVRRRMRRGHARGWGPYLVLLYGTVMTLGAFYWLSNDWLAILAMLIIFLSTLGLYTLFVIVGVGFNVLGAPGKALDFVRDRRD